MTCSSAQSDLCGQMSMWDVAKCPCGKMSMWLNVHVAKCPCQISGGQKSKRLNCLAVKLLGEKDLKIDEIRVF